MTRTAAREVAVNLIFAAAASPELTPEELLDNFFDPEHYKTLSDKIRRYGTNRKDAFSFIFSMYYNNFN